MQVGQGVAKELHTDIPPDIHLCRIAVYKSITIMKLNSTKVLVQFFCDQVSIHIIVT